MTNKTLEAVRGVLGLVAGDYLYTLHEANQDHIDNGNPEECIDLDSFHKGLIEIAKAFNLDIKEFDIDGLIEEQQIEPKDEVPDDKIVDIHKDAKPEVTISYQEAINRAQQGTLPTCPHLERVKVFKACYADCIIQYIFGTECNLPDGWEVEELGYLSYINMTNKDEDLQRMIDEYLDGDAGSCREDCVHYKSCNE